MSQTCRIEERKLGLFVLVDNQTGSPIAAAGSLRHALLTARQLRYSVSYTRSLPVTEPLVSVK